MGKFNQFMEEKFVPVASKIGAEKHLVAIRDAFIGIMPITMAGSIAVLFNVFLRDLPTQAFGTAENVITNTFAGVIGVNGNVWWASIAVLSLVFVFSLGYNLSNAYNINPLAGGLVAFSALISTMPQVATFDATISGVTESVTGWGYFPVNFTNVTGLFTALIVGFLATLVYIFLMKKKVTIKLPQSVPPAVSKAFAAIIPGVVAIYLAATASYLVSTYASTTINELILTYIQKPLLGLSQGLFSVIIITILVQLFWFFGLHGTNVLAPIIDGVYKTALLENNTAFGLAGTSENLPYIWTRGSFDSFVWLGGAGCTLALIVALFIFSKREDQRAVAKLSAPMGVFNINEPVIFGLPLVLNTIYIIPFVLIPPVLSTIAYFATYIGLIPAVFVEVPWVIPPVFFAILSTGGNLMAGLVALVNFIIGVLLWSPFVIVANKIKTNDN